MAARESLRPRRILILSMSTDAKATQSRVNNEPTANACVDCAHIWGCCVDVPCEDYGAAGMCA